jgi:hypothetical protein
MLVSNTCCVISDLHGVFFWRTVYTFLKRSFCIIQLQEDIYDSRKKEKNRMSLFYIHGKQGRSSLDASGVS